MGRLKALTDAYKNQMVQAKNTDMSASAIEQSHQLSASAHPIPQHLCKDPKMRYRKMKAASNLNPLYKNFSIA